MQFYEITLQPVSGFGTPLKGDTLFGHFCWQAVYDSDLLDDGLKELLAVYPEKPFAIFSSAILKLKTDGDAAYILKKPDMPLSHLFAFDQENRKARFEKIKAMKQKKWIKMDRSLHLDLAHTTYLTDRELADWIALQHQESEPPSRMPSNKFIMSLSQPHNTINRLTQSTGTGAFAPYSQEIFHYYPGTRLSVFALIDESATDIERVVRAFKNIGRWGFGKDASIGMGRFSVESHTPCAIPQLSNADAFYTLAPSVPDKNAFSKSYFMPFIRFGKHGDRLARGRNPFKNPVIMADEGAVFITAPGAAQSPEPYLGRAVKNVSKSMPETVVQGYAPCLPLTLEG